MKPDRITISDTSSQKARFIRTFFCVISAVYFLSLILTSCADTKPVQGNSNKYLYGEENYKLSPDYTIYHQSDDSSTLYFRIGSKNLLYTRAGTGDPFEASIKIHYELYRPNDRSPLDSGSFVMKDYNHGGVSIALSGSHTISAKPGIYSLHLVMTDLKREESVENIVPVDKSSVMTAQNFLLSHRSDFTEPLFGHYCASGDTLFVTSPRLGLNTSLQQPENLKFLGYKTDIRLPPPPFSSNIPELPSMEDGINVGLHRDSLNNWYVLPESGFYFLTATADEKSGYPLFIAPSSYPKVETFDQLVWPLRYITSKNEFEQISGKSFPKTYIDNFWIECGGTKDRARELIKTYYSRVEQANTFFSTYTEGWRTDRGMIHLIFGNPNKINKTAETETWIYGEERNPASLILTFRRINHPLSDNVFLLTREPILKQYWEQMVTAWRQGRVFND
ncbi:MAG: GWxTD domain-containing protein [Crocinitomicaceae bacterium]|nr:GWxTD domain-containing protein [Crocinitomicaceae bacterium]